MDTSLPTELPEDTAPKCDRCPSRTPDLRTLRVSCFYDMAELAVPFRYDKEARLYTLRICKDCRREFLMTFQAWFDHPQAPQVTGTGAWVRELGATREMTQAEIAEREARGMVVYRIKAEEDQES